jgi:hypothetical protein
MKTICEHDYVFYQLLDRCSPVLVEFICTKCGNIIEEED